MDFKKYAAQTLIAVSIIALGSAYYFYSEYSTLKQGSDKLAQEETSDLIAQVGKLMNNHQSY